MTTFFRKLSWLTQRRRKERELREELQFHLDEEAEQRQAEGLAKDQARWAARRDLGNFTLLQESTRAMWTWTSLEQLVQDLRYALRTMINNRAFTALAALSLALGIGANTAIYSFFDALLLRSLPVSDPASLVVLNWHAKAWRKDFVMQGMSAALGISRFAESLLFGIRSNDPLALALAVAILLSATLLAGYVPARNASRIDPMTALRYE
jgi:hypothetical protein